MRNMQNKSCIWLGLVFVQVLLGLCCSEKVNRSRIKAIPEWAKELVLYEVCLPVYSERGGITELSADLKRLRGLHVKGIILQPTLWIDSLTNQDLKRNRFSIVDHINPFRPDVNPSMIRQFIHQAHTTGLKVFIKWNIRSLSINHAFIKSNSALTIKENYTESFNSHCAVLDLQQPDAVQFMTKRLDKFSKIFDVDGFVLTDTEFATDLFWAACMANIEKWDQLLWINRQSNAAPPNPSRFHFEYHENLFRRIVEFNKSDDPLPLMYYLDTVINSPFQFWVNYSYPFEEHLMAGPEVYIMGDKLKLLEALIQFVPGAPLIYNGQEEPQYKKLDPQMKQYMSIGKNYHRDFHRSLFILKQNNPALWIDNISIRKIYSDQNILAIERKNRNHVVVGMFNLSPQHATFSLGESYINFFNLSNKAPVNFRKGEIYRLSPYQHIVISNSI